MAVPPVVMIVPLFVLYTRLGLISTYQGAILIYAGLITPFSVYLLTTLLPHAAERAVRSRRASTAPATSASSGRSCCRSRCRPW